MVQTKPLRTMKHMAKKGKMVVKKWGFRGKMLVLGLEKLRACNQTRKLKWCKLQALSLKIDRVRDAKS